MRGTVVIDTNLSILLIVGSASRNYVARHKNLRHYTEYHFDLLGEILKEFSVMVTLPHVLAQTSDLVKQISGPAYRAVQAAFRTFVEGATELPVSSKTGCERTEFAQLGLIDAVLLSVCALDIAGIRPTLLTADGIFADSALSLGYSVIDYRREYMSG